MAALFASGATLWAGSLFVLVRRAMRFRRAIQASGVVIRIETEYEVRSIGGFDRILVPRYVPMIHFGTADDPDVVARLPATSSGQYCFGQRVSFLYDPRHPQYVAMSHGDYWRDITPFFLIGMLCFASLLWLR